MRFATILLGATLLAPRLAAQPQLDTETVWKEFLQWYRAAPAQVSEAAFPEEAYRTKLLEDGVPEAEVTRRYVLLSKLESERTEALEIWFNHVFAREKPSFRTEPNALLMETVKDLKPGHALDVAMGQGRNAIWLASLGWDVTGFDISDEALAAARVEAKKKGLKIEAVHSGWQNFDFGKEQWDLIVLSYAFVPIWNPAFVARLRASLKKGGLVVFEHFLLDGPNSPPKFTGIPEPNDLPRLFLPDFRILRYEDTVAVSEWFPRKAPLVRMVARKL